MSHTSQNQKFGAKSWSILLVAVLVGKIFIVNSEYTCSAKVIAGLSSASGFYKLGSRGDNGAATSANLYNPNGIGLNGAKDTLLIGDRGNNAIRAINLASNIITHFAGGYTDAYVNSYTTSSYKLGNGGDKAATSVGMVPDALCTDTTGNIFFVDNPNVIRKISLAGILSLVAGNGVFRGASAVDGPFKATSANLNDVIACAIDTSGDLYLTDSANHKLRKINMNNNIMTTFAGSGQTAALINSAPTSSSLATPKSLFIDSVGNLFVCEQAGRIRSVAVGSNQMTTFAGSLDANAGGVGVTSALLGEDILMAGDIWGNMFLSNVGKSTMRFLQENSGILTTMTGFSSTRNMIAHQNYVYVSAGKQIRQMTCQYSVAPTTSPSMLPTTDSSVSPSVSPSAMPSASPSAVPTAVPSMVPSAAPSTLPTTDSSVTPSVSPSAMPSASPSAVPSAVPSMVPSAAPSTAPSATPSTSPSAGPTDMSDMPTITPSNPPSALPSVSPSATPSESPSATPSEMPSEVPTVEPSASPSEVPSATPSVSPSATPSESPSATPSETPSEVPTVEPSASPSEVPSATPSVSPSATPSETPSQKPTQDPTVVPTVRPSRMPTNKPTVKPTPTPTDSFSGLGISTTLVIEGVDVDLTTGGDLRGRRLARAGSMLLMEVSDLAIITTIAAVLELSEESVEILSESIVSNVTSRATMLVEFKILAPAEGFASYEACFDFFSGRLSQAVADGEIHAQLVDIAEDVGAFELYQITAVNATMTNDGAIDTSVPDRDDISEGDFVGVVIGIVVAFLVLAALAYCCISGSGGGFRSGSDEAQKSSPAEASFAV